MIRASATLLQPPQCHLSTHVAGLVAICLDYWCVSARINAKDCFEKRVETILDESIPRDPQRDYSEQAVLCEPTLQAISALSLAR